MTPALAPSTILVDQVGDWLTDMAFTGAELDQIARGTFDRLAAAGLPIARAQVTFSILHPLYRAVGFTWRRLDGLKIEAYRHVQNGQSDRFRRSPYFVLLSNRLEYLRRRISVEEVSEFPILEELKQEGMTDYLAYVHSFEPYADDDRAQGMMGSWTTDRPGGFIDADIAALLKIQSHLALVSKMAVLKRLAGNVLTTYLGGDAGRRVMSGQIKRGDGETIRAALVIGDMRNSTELSERLGRQGYIDTLDEFFDAIAKPFSMEGGQILSFLGDGFLAVYPCERHRAESQEACQKALKAAEIAMWRMGDFNRRRLADNNDAIGFGIGLHVGNVMFGNVGLQDRLTFSAFGRAVNEVTRLENLTKKYAVPLVASAAFVEYCGGAWNEMGKEKLRGVEQEMTVYSPQPGQVITEEMCRFADSLEEDGYSDAENVVLLHRDSKRLPHQEAVAS
jgi:adenylate cyclase